MDLTISRRANLNFAIGLSVIAVLLCIASVVVAHEWFVNHHDSMHHMVPMFYADLEANFPNWFSGLLLALSSLLLALIAQSKRGDPLGDTVQWAFLALVFLFLSMDEIAGVHNLLDGPVRRTLHTSGAFYLAWVIPYGILTLLMGMAYLRFLWRLPRATGICIAIAGIVYVWAALGMEMVESPLEAKYGTHDMRLAWLASIEESLEMLAVIFFNFTLIRYLSEHIGSVTVRFGNGPKSVS